LPLPVCTMRGYIADGGLMRSAPMRSNRTSSRLATLIASAAEEPGEVQAPTKYGLVANLKTAKSLGLDAPP
jgi:hypothetical protein